MITFIIVVVCVFCYIGFASFLGKMLRYNRQQLDLFIVCHDAEMEIE